MPIYEYKCPLCNTRKEYLRQTHASEPMPCPNCDAPLQRVISSTSFRLTGKGWYETDYRTPDKKTAQPETAPKDATKADDAQSGTGQTDSKDTTKSTPSSSSDTGTSEK